VIVIVAVVMVGPKPNYNWIGTLLRRPGESTQELFVRAEAWGREKASAGYDEIWVEVMEAQP